MEDPILRLDGIIKWKGDWMVATNLHTALQQPDTFEEQQSEGDTLNLILIQNGVQALMQSLMNIEVSRMLDANRYERSSKRRAYRNGYRTTQWTTTLGEIELRIPKLRQGTYYPERLLNDPHIMASLIKLVQKCILEGIHEQQIADSLSKLDFIPLTPFESHQISDAIRVELESAQAVSHLAKVDHSYVKPVTVNPSKYMILMQKRSITGRLEIADVEQPVSRDREFWRDFTRRMAHAGFDVEDHQSVLSTINPYASLRIDTTIAVRYANFARHIHSSYENEYQLSA